jgi:hypothetical protein
MLSATVKFKGTACETYIGEYKETYIISIPELSFSMQMSSDLTEEEMAEELIIHLFTVLDEDESEEASEAILSVIRTELGEINGYKR